jgi:hypothetical protein
MYYGGDAIDLLVFMLLRRNWYLSTRPRSSLPAVAADGVTRMVSRGWCQWIVSKVGPIP